MTGQNWGKHFASTLDGLVRRNEEHFAHRGK
jgi:hypothetical protein